MSEIKNNEKTVIGLNIDYAALIKRIRNNLLVSQTELAEMLGVSFATINRWENGHHEPTIKAKRKLRELMKTYDIKLEENSNGSR